MFNNMDRISKKAILSAVLIAISCVIFMSAQYFNNFNFSSKEFVVQGTFVEKKDFFVNRNNGNVAAGGVRLFFKIDAEKIVVITQNRIYPEVKPGDRVNIYYHYGTLLKNKIYDYYQRL